MGENENLVYCLCENNHLWEAGFIKVFDPTSTAQLFIWKDLTHLLCRLLCGQRSICSCMLQMACARPADGNKPTAEHVPYASSQVNNHLRRKNGPGLTVKSIHKLPRGSPVELLKRTGCLSNGHHARWKLWLSVLSCPPPRGRKRLLFFCLVPHHFISYLDLIRHYFVPFLAFTFTLTIQFCPSVFIFSLFPPSVFFHASQSIFNKNSSSLQTGRLHC